MSAANKASSNCERGKRTAGQVYGAKTGSERRHRAFHLISLPFFSVRLLQLIVRMRNEILQMKRIENEHQESCNWCRSGSGHEFIVNELVP